MLTIYDIRGRELETLLNKPLPKGDHSVEFDGTGYSPGVYYYRLQMGDAAVTKKCIISR